MAAVREWGPRQWVKVRCYGIAWLGFLGFPVQSLLSRHDTARTVLGITGMVAFAACYTRVVWRAVPVPHTNRTPYALAGTLVIGVALTVLIGFDMVTALAFYAIALLLVSLPRRWWLLSVTVISLGYLAAGLLTGRILDDVIGTDIALFVVGWLATAFYMQIQDKRQLHQARADLARLAVSEERLRIARDLHDVMGQRLAAVALKSDLAVRLLRTDPDRAETEMTEVGPGGPRRGTHHRLRIPRRLPGRRGAHRHRAADRRRRRGHRVAGTGRPRVHCGRGRVVGGTGGRHQRGPARPRQPLPDHAGPSPGRDRRRRRR
jgi:hypothetical protein